MTKRSIRRSQIANSSKPTGDRRRATYATRSGARTPRRPGPTPLLDGILAELKVPRPLPEDIAKDPGYLSLQIWGLADLLRGAAMEEDLTREAGFFVAAYLDDVAVRLTR